MMRYFCKDCNSYTCSHQQELETKAKEATQNSGQVYNHEEE